MKIQSSIRPISLFVFELHLVSPSNFLPFVVHGRAEQPTPSTRKS
jgi:hypothetical protein